MFGSSNMVDLVDDLNKYFPRTRSNDSDTPFTYTSPFQTGNRSSSSADSISPESYFENFRPEIRPETPRTFFDFRAYESPVPQDVNIFDRTYDSFQIDPNITNFVPLQNSPTSSLNTFPVKPQRPIVGRKILGSQPKESNKNETNSWQMDVQKSYELFPRENKGYEFCTPIKSSSYSMPKQSPSRLNYPSPGHRFTPKSSNFECFNPVSTPSSSTEEFGSKMCTFCRKNGETPLVYMTHCVKEKIGNKHIVTCPILRSHECKTCGASGDNAHTLTYCPVLRNSNNGKPLQSTTISLKNTRIKSNGRRRY